MSADTMGHRIAIRDDTDSGFSLGPASRLGHKLICASCRGSSLAYWQQERLWRDSDGALPSWTWLLDSLTQRWRSNCHSGTIATYFSWNIRGGENQILVRWLPSALRRVLIQSGHIRRHRDERSWRLCHQEGTVRSVCHEPILWGCKWTSNPPYR